MKKVSTAAAKMTRNFQDQELTIGLDLGDRASWYCWTKGVSSSKSADGRVATGGTRRTENLVPRGNERTT
jgi:hypothetical protein